jgi:hypothetical protein
VKTQVAFDYAERIGGLTKEQRLYFYEVLAHQLTVAARMVWSDEALSDTQKVTQLKWLNEILHRVTAKVYTLRLQTHEWSEADSFDDIRHWISQEPAIAPRVGWAVMVSYQIVTGQPVEANAAEQFAPPDGGRDFGF